MASRATLKDLGEHGTPLELSTAGEVETLVRAHGTRFVVTNRNGDITPRGARELGLFSDDTRYLSFYELSIRHRSGGSELALVHLSASAVDLAENRIDRMVTGLGDQEFLDDPQNFLHVRRRQLVDDGFHEQIELVNYRDRAVELEVVIGFAADFADVFEIRGAKRPQRGHLRSAEISEAAVELAYDGRDRTAYRTRLQFSPAPTRLTDDTATFRVALEAGVTTRIDIAIEPHRGNGPRRAAGLAVSAEGAFDQRANAERERAERFLEESTRFRCDNATLAHVLDQSTMDLRALSIGIGDHEVLAAGIPWFCCPFGRDTLLAAYEALTLNPALAASSLRTLAAYQGKEVVSFTEEEPGKIFHELRFGEMAACGEIPHTPYYGSIDATPLFVIVAHATHKVTGDEALLRELAPAVTRALAWIDQRSDEGRHLVTYERQSARGLDNQGWKDSRAGVSSPDGRPADPPIALVEVQGYCIDAYRRGAELLATLGDEIAARLYEARASRLLAVVEGAFWLPAEGRYALAIDGHGTPLPTVVSNIGHLLWSRVPPPDRARASADLLCQPESLSAFGIRTLAERQPVYNPLSYHNGTVWPHDNALIAKGFANYDLMEHACSVFEAMLSAMAEFPNRRLPELFCGTARDRMLVRYPVACSPQAWAAAAPFLLLQSVLGIHIDAGRQRLLIRNPRMPTSVSRVEIEQLRVGRSRVSLRLHRVGKRCHVDRLDVTGAPLRTFVEIE